MWDLLLASFSVFWVTRVVRVWVKAPEWMWSVWHLSLCIAATFPWNNSRPWLAPLAVAGIVAFLQLLENFLIAKADESVAAVIRRR